MSLFRAREWWAHGPAGGAEECHAGCLAVGNVDNAPADAAAAAGPRLVTGSFDGMLRVYAPSAGGGGRVEDLLLEERLGAPVLQLLIGTFLPSSQAMALAVLHPRRLVVYTVAASADGGASYHELRQAYRHDLPRTAFNMTCGRFGGVYEREHLCVQSMDGLLSFYEQSRAAFSVQLPDFCLPGPLCYVEKTDCIVTVATSMAVRAYRYQVLAAAAASGLRPHGSGSSQSLGSTVAGDEAGGGGDGGGGNAGAVDEDGFPAAPASGGGGVKLGSSKTVREDWSTNIGEQALEVRVGRFSRSLGGGQVDLLVLGERTLFVLRETGEVRMQKRFDYHPACMAAYDRAPPAAAAAAAGAAGGSAASGQNLLVGTHEGSLMVYNDVRLVWAARAAEGGGGGGEGAAASGPSPPVALAVVRCGGLNGLVAALDDRCRLTLSYMGTDPPARAVQRAEDTKALDYVEMDREHQRLLGAIKRAQSDAAAEPADRLAVSCQVPDRLDTPDEYPNDRFDETPGLVRDGGAAPAGAPASAAPFVSVTARVFLRLAGAAEARDVSVSLEVPPGVHVDDPTFVVPLVRGGATPHVQRVRFRLREGLAPDSLVVRLVASRTTEQGHPRTARCTLELPLALAAEARLPVKNARFTLTLETNRPPPPLTDLFPDVLLPAIRRAPDVQRSAAGVMSLFSRATGEDATVLVSKKSGRFRVQGGSFAALWTLTGALVARLRAHFERQEEAGGGGGGGGGGEPFRAGFAGPAPLQDYFGAVDEHFAARAAVRRLHTQLERDAVRFRAVQKRLLARFRDKNPAPLGGMDVLLRESYDRLQTHASGMERAQEAETAAASRLAAATRLFLALASLQHGLSAAQAAALERHWTPDVAGYTTRLAPSSAAADGDVGDEGWHEVVDAGLRHLLRTSLSRSAREQRAAPERPGPLPDTAKLKKHMQIVCERLRQWTA